MKRPAARTRAAAPVIHWRSISSPGAASGSRPVSIITIPPGTRWPRFPGHRLPPGAAVGGRRAPQALLILSARFARVSWKYRSIAYATVLKDVGVLLQTMYLVAEAMGLASCAAGCGDAALLARTIGSRLYEESSVGEFLLGRTA